MSVPLLLTHSLKNLSFFPIKHRYFSSTVSQLMTLSAYQSAIKNNVKVAIDFTATWCPPCKVIGPKFDAFAGVYPQIKFYKLDVDVNTEAARDANIKAMPTFKFYHNGDRVNEFVGASEVDLKNKLDSLNRL